MMQTPTVLVVLDGWGLAPPGPGNAIDQAKLTHIPRYLVSYPHTQLAASGTAVGLPANEDGNTETGHINLGAGRVVYQDLPRINMAITDGSFYQNEAFMGAFSYAKLHLSAIHIMGLIGEGSVHSNIEHLGALLTLSKLHTGGRPIYLHLFTDGRDSPPTAAPRLLEKVESLCKGAGVGSIATIIGRYFAMDRDRRWDRTEKAYRALTELGDKTAPTALVAVETAYKAGKTDEFIEPTIILGKDGKPLPRISEGDAVIFFNYRIDRPRQLTKAFVLSDFESDGHTASFDPYAVKYYHKHVIDEQAPAKPFERRIKLTNLFFVTMTEYERNLPCTIAYPPELVKNPLGRVISEHGYRQLRMSETEKERFVTYYFNGMREDPFPGEDHLIIPSAKVATYDLKPDMSARELTDKLIDRLKLGFYAFILVNFANADMVAHTGNIPASIAAVQVLDECLDRIITQILHLGGCCIITADHGNVEEMLGPSGEVDTEHSMFPVPFVVISPRFINMPVTLPTGKLSDIAPTILALMNLPIPSDMSGRNLLIDVLPKGG